MKEFNPGLNLASAILNLKAGTKISFNEEYAIETLWHEIMHGIVPIRMNKAIIGRNGIDEGVIQALARRTYPDFLSAYAVTPKFQNEILANGYAYPEVTRNVLM